MQVLCAYDLLNEGWDAPQTQVLLMARPTLSKVIYQQQLGRGMRPSEGKKCLVIFDFVDAFSRHNQALSIHRWLKKAQYRAGERIFEPGADDEADTELPLHLWARDVVPVSVFDWQEQVEGMMSARAISLALRKNEEWVWDKYLRGEIEADEIIELGDDRRVPYFVPQRVAEMREKFGLKEVTDANIFEDFERFVNDMTMTRSYKPVLLLSLLAHVDEKGQARVSDVAQEFLKFYRDRHERGEMVERAPSPLLAPSEVTLPDAQGLMNRFPFNRFNRLDYIGYAKDRAFYQFNKAIWKQLSNPETRVRIEELARRSLQSYYARS